MSEQTRRERIHFVTGRLAADAVRRQLDALAPQVGFEYTLQVAPITVAALLTTQWLRRHLQAPPGTERVILPGYIAGDLALLQPSLGADRDVRIERGPRDIRDLPAFFGAAASNRDQYGQYDIEILAEINHAPRLALADVLEQAEQLRKDGADLIDVGCDPDGPWPGVGECVRALRDQGHRVSIDSLDPREIAPAVANGAELVLSVNSRNRAAAADWGCEVVAIPDEPRDTGSLRETIERLAQQGVPLRADPILEPLGVGCAASLLRYLELRRELPDLEMLMGIGNLTELTDADSCGINVLLIGLCQELGIRSVLTTQVIPWAQSSVRECNLARRLMHFAVSQGIAPKRIEPNLLLLRDPQVQPHGAEFLNELSERVRDPNYRLFAEGGRLHLITAGLHLEAEDPFELFARLSGSGPDGKAPANLDPSHAFYLGFELSKAVTALTLGKQYTQDEALRWGLLTREEASHGPGRRATAIRSAARASGESGETESGETASGETESGETTLGETTLENPGDDAARASGKPGETGSGETESGETESGE